MEDDRTVRVWPEIVGSCPGLAALGAGLQLRDREEGHGTLRMLDGVPPGLDAATRKRVGARVGPVEGDCTSIGRGCGVPSEWRRGVPGPWSPLSLRRTEQRENLDGAPPRAGGTA